MKHVNFLLAILALVCFVSISKAQILLTDQAVYGGSKSDHLRDAQRTIDGGFILAGGSYSNDGNVTGSHGPDDSWIVKLDENLGLQWQKALGGSDREEALGIKQGQDGSYFVVSYSKSDDGDVSENFGEGDYWVSKLDPSGNLIWEKTYGGSDLEYPSDITTTSDGGFVVTGRSRSNDGNVSGNKGGADAWVLKCDASGNIQWAKCYGGSNFDQLGTVESTADGGYILIGYTWSNDGDASGNHGDSDVWAVKLDGLGNIEWRRVLGGTMADYGRDIKQTTDGGYVLIASVYSTNGNVSGNNGGSDYWIVKLDAAGNILWRQCYGGSNDEIPWGISLTNYDGFIITGQSESADGNVVGNKGDKDVWTVRLNSSGNFIWGKTMGSSNWDYGQVVFELRDREYAIFGGAGTDDGDIILDLGFNDYLAFKMVECPFINCVEDIQLPNDVGICGAEVTFAPPTLVFGCNSVSIVQTSGPESSSIFPSGTTTVGFLATDVLGATATCSFTVTVTSDIGAEAGADETVIIDSGPGPDPYPCVTLGASATGGSGPYTYSWLPTTGLSNSNIADPEACPTVTTTYTLTVTDANGCTDTDELTVTVIDIDNAGSLPTVGNNSNKVYVCHLATCTTVEANIQANCNSPHSLCAHISHGDVLGPCECKTDGNSASQSADHTTQIMAVPNPFMSATHILFTLGYDSDVQLTVMDITGKEVAQLFTGPVKEGVVNRATFNGADLASGIYFYHLTTDLGERISEKLVLTR